MMEHCPCGKNLLISWLAEQLNDFYWQQPDFLNNGTQHMPIPVEQTGHHLIRRMLTDKKGAVLCH